MVLISTDENKSIPVLQFYILSHEGLGKGKCLSTTILPSKIRNQLGKCRTISLSNSVLFFPLIIFLPFSLCKVPSWCRFFSMTEFFHEKMLVCLVFVKKAQSFLSLQASLLIHVTLSVTLPSPQNLSNFMNHKFMLDKHVQVN